MARFKAVVEYDGTCYHGWQFQKGVPTVQAAIEASLKRILGVDTRVFGAGRTDAGVHALGQVIHFDASWSRSTQELHRACNALLPADVSIRSMEVVSEDFHARHAARSKTYSYHVLTRHVRSPVMRLYSWHIPDLLDVVAMADAAGAIVGSHDFATFGAPTDGTTSTVREIREARWDVHESAEQLVFTIRGSGFLRYMVRCLVGTLVRVGRGKMTAEQFTDVLRSRDRSLAGPAAPAAGLFLVRVEYDCPSSQHGADNV